MAPRSSAYTTLNVERFEDRIVPNANLVFNLIGGGSFFSSLLSAGGNFDQGYNATKTVLDTVGGQSDLAHVTLDVGAIFGTIYGGAYLAGARTAVAAGIATVASQPGGNGALVAGLGYALQALAFSAGAAYAVEQDLVAHGIPIIDTISSFGQSVLQKVKNAAIATLDSVSTIYSDLKALATDTVDQALQQLSQSLVPPDDPTLSSPSGVFDPDNDSDDDNGQPGY